MIAFQLNQRGLPEEALRYSEQSKARVLWDWMLTSPSGTANMQGFQPAAAEAPDLQTLRHGLPEGTVLIEYSVLPQKTIIWILRRTGKTLCVTVAVDARKLADLAWRFRRALMENRPAEMESLSRQLYSLLIHPVERSLAPGERIVVIPDGALHALPFSLLRDPAGRFLLQNHAVSVAPSARVYLEGLRREKLLPPPGRVLVVAAPDFDPTVDPTLRVLSAGSREALIAQIFPGSELLHGAKARRQAFLTAARDAEAIYFGGHSVVNAEVPLLSQMLFAKDPSDPSRGVLYAGDVLRQRFPRTRLVVLASCSTALGKTSRTEGVESLARPFLAAGVPTVVASLWNVDDKETADFFVRFFQRLRQRFDVAEALRATQVESLRQGSSPAGWGAFEVIGGGVPSAEAEP